MPLVMLKELSPQCASITLNDPDNLNAMGEEMAAEFAALVEKLRVDGSTYRSIILTGSGRAFSAGGNLEMLEKKQQLSEEENQRLMLRFYHAFLGVLSLNIPLIAAVNGHAIGAGLCLAAACDIRIASDQAKFGVTFTRLGLHPGMGATYFLPRVLGYPAAVELMLSGRVIEAPEALRIGFVSKIVPVATLESEALAIAREISACGPEANRQVLQTLRAGSTSLVAALEREALSQSMSYKSAEFKEGVRAAIEKRKPTF